MILIAACRGRVVPARQQKIHPEPGGVSPGLIKLFVTQDLNFNQDCQVR
jgi:hypothetical protein